MVKGVVVIGGHVQGLGIIRIIGKNKIPCYLLDESPINIARHSKYCNRFIEIDQNNNFIEFLIRINKEFKLNDWLLIPTNDYYVKLLSQNKKSLEKYYKSSIDDWSVIKYFYYKRLTYARVESLEVDMPKTYFPDDLEDIEKIDLNFPCIIKPSVMHKLFSQIKKKVIVCNDKKELVENYYEILKC